MNDDRLTALLILLAVIVAIVVTAMFATSSYAIPWVGEKEGILTVLQAALLIVLGPAGLYLAFNRTRSATQQADAALEQTKVANRNTMLSELGQQADRFRAATQMLKSEEEAEQIAALNDIGAVAENASDLYLESAIAAIVSFITRTLARGTDHSGRTFIASRLAIRLLRKLQDLSGDTPIELNCILIPNYKWNASWKNTIFYECELSSFNQSALSERVSLFEKCTFTRSSSPYPFFDTSFIGCSFEFFQLIRGAEERKLDPQWFSRSTIKDTSFSFCELKDWSFYDCVFEGCNWDHCNFTGCLFYFESQADIPISLLETFRREPTISDAIFRFSVSNKNVDLRLTADGAFESISPNDKVD